MITFFTVLMVGTALAAWYRTGRPWVAVCVVLIFAAGALAAHNS
jgi:uncharacterized membrane protein